MTRASPPLTVCILSGPPLARTARILSLLRDAADEIVCAIDSRTPVDEIAQLEGLADRLMLCEVEGLSNIEQALTWLHSQCEGQWILRVDSDEVPSQELISQLPELLKAKDVLQYLIPRRWVWPDPRHFLDEHPWKPDWQIRLVRNEPAFLRFRGVIHTSVDLAWPHRYLDAPIYHLDCLLKSPDERREKACRYEVQRPGHATERGFPVNDFYVPEDVSRSAPGDVPADEIAPIQAVLVAAQSQPLLLDRGAPTDVPLVRLDEIERRWAGRDVTTNAYAARVEVLENLEIMRPGERRDVVVRVYNEGTTTWPWGDFEPRIVTSHRWLDRPGQEGNRSFFTADLHPGTSAIQVIPIEAPPAPGLYTLELDVVHEGVRWFDSPTRCQVRVQAARADTL